MEMGPDFALLKDAYAIIDGIPETAISLDKLRSAKGDSLEHGTVCSPVGWLAQHPDFMRFGLSLNEDGSELLLHGKPTMEDSPAYIMARIFGLSPVDANQLFGDRDTYTLGDDSGLSDKRLWQRELRDYLKAHGQLDPEFEERLETRGPFADPANPSELRTL
ncbi:hypothetical protein [Noviherbaspirillum saxi]|uniref:Uncharacterized protein n=1 Tax=Noviherbaspirillum saxi TaxID=2320863 RepID=A0A3A3FKX8_9BURK|nr:hypothetical protein [Noviherbaspirillum saxi]RJF96143.1 hypothetical protein D3871_22685 [Noviherbaspirillum saxi]